MTTAAVEISTWVRLLARKSRALSTSVVSSSGALSSFWVILRRWVVGGIECSSGRRPAEDQRSLARLRLHLVFEILGRHPLEDLGPFVARHTGEVLIRSLLFALRLVELAGSFEHFLGHVDGRLGAQRQRDRVARPRIYFERLAVARLDLNPREVGVFAQLGDLGQLDCRAELGQQIAQQVVRHRALRLDPFELGGHRGGLERADPDVQVELVVGILEDDDGHLGRGVERDPTYDHQNEVFPVTGHRRALQSFLFKRARLRVEIQRVTWRKYLGPKTPCGQPNELPIKLVEIAALFHQVAVRGVAIHFAVAEAPGIAAFRIKPDHFFGALADFTQAPFVREIVIVARVAEHDDGGALVDGAQMIGDEVAERVAEIRVGVYVDDVALECDVERFLGVIVAKAFGYFTDVGDEDEAAHARVEILQRVNELQHESRRVAHRIRNVAQDYDLRFLFLALLEAELERNAAVFEVLAKGALDVEAALLGTLAAHGDHVFQALRQARHRLVHFLEFFFAQVIETLLADLVEALIFLLLDVAFLALHPDVAADDVVERLETALEIFFHLGLELGADIHLLELLAQLLDLGFDLVEAELAGERARKIVLLDRALDPIELDGARGLADFPLHLARVVLQQLLSKLGEILALLLEHLLDLIEEFLKFLIRHRKRVLHGLARLLDNLAEAGEVDIEEFLEHGQFAGSLDHRGPQCGAERIALGEAGDFGGAECVERFRQRDAHTVLAQQVRKFDELLLHGVVAPYPATRLNLRDPSPGPGWPLGHAARSI